MQNGFYHVVTFRLSNETYSINILTISEIIRLVNITRLPNTSEAVEGIISLRGKVLPVVDMRKMFNLAPMEEKGSHARIVVASANGSPVGLIVDAVSEVLQIPADRLEPPQNVLGERRERAIAGIYNREDGKLIIHLDLEKLFQDGSIGDVKKAVGSEKPEEGSGKVELEDDPVRVRSVDEVLKEAKNISEDNRAVWSEETNRLIKELVHVICSMREGEFDTPITEMDDVNLELFGEVGNLAKIVQQFRDEFRESLDPKMKLIASEKIPETTDHLHAVISTQESATHRVLELTETLTDKTDALTKDMKELEKIIESVRTQLDRSGRVKKDQVRELLDAISGVKDGTLSKLNENSSILIDIMTEMGFQDLTGQRIKKTIDLINEIEVRLKEIMVHFGVKLELLKNPGVDEDERRAEITGLLSQEGNIGGQDAIDDLLAELGL